MIEGLRLLPWLQQAARSKGDAVSIYTNCEECMQVRPAAVRQTMRCGFEPALDDLHLTSTWWPDGFSGFPTDSGPGLASTCPGYTTKLPEVVEASRLHWWWSKGQLRDRVEGGVVNDRVIEVVEIIGAEVAAVEAHEIDERSKKAGR